MSKVLLDFYLNCWWELYLGCLLGGLASALAILWVPNANLLRRYSVFLQFLLYFAAGSAVVTVSITVAHYNDSPWAGICFMNMRFAWFFVDGVLLAALIASPAVIRGAIPRDKSLSRMVLLPQTVWAAQVSVASQYVSAGLLKFLGRETLDFFHMSGYSTAFFFFIAAWELVWGIGVLWRSAAILSLVALSLDMVGAIYTHYHNYFTRGYSGPFGNSLDALRMLLLMTYVAFALIRQQHGHGTGQIQVESSNPNT